MKSINSVIAILLLSSCATVSAPNHTDISMKMIDAVQVGDNAKSVSSSLGKPTDVLLEKTDPASESWIYDGDNAQRAAVEVSHESQKVIAVTILPRETEPEFKLDFLLKNKFANVSFEKIPSQICSRDYIPPQVFYVDARSGVVITANRFTGEVEHFGRLLPSEAVSLIKNIKTCKR